MIVRAKSPTGRSEKLIFARKNATEEWILLKIAPGKSDRGARAEAHLKPEDALEIGYALINSAHDLLDEHAPVDPAAELIGKRIVHKHTGNTGRVVSLNPDAGGTNQNDIIVEWDHRASGGTCPTVSTNVEVITDGDG